MNNKSKFNRLYFVKKLIDATLYALIIWVVLFLVFYDSAIVYDISMQPTLNKQSGVVDNDIVYYRKWTEVDYGDIIIISTNNNEFIIKRCIAKSGDRIRYVYDKNLDKYDLFLNNEKRKEDYVKEEITPNKLKQANNPIKFTDATDESGMNPFGMLKNNQPYNFDEEGNYVVPKGCVFAMGDNRIYSTDSKMQGAYSEDCVVGVVRLIISHDDNTLLKLLKYIFA